MQCGDKSCTKLWTLILKTGFSFATSFTSFCCSSYQEADAAACYNRSIIWKKPKKGFPKLEKRSSSLTWERALRYPDTSPQYESNTSPQGPIFHRGPISVLTSIPHLLTDQSKECLGILGAGSLLSFFSSSGSLE